MQTIHLVTKDETLRESTRAAVAALDGFGFRHWPSMDALADLPPAAGDVILLDASPAPENVYEVARRMTGVTRCRTFLITERENTWAQAIAHFCGATDVLARPLSAKLLRAALGAEPQRGPLKSDGRGSAEREPVLPEALLRDLAGPQSDRLIESLTDPETHLFNFEFLNFKLDEEFKRAHRFGAPLSCVMLGFEGPASTQVLRELAAIFLQASRDTDILGRFDESSFLFLLPHTGPDGARVMAGRVSAMASEQGLADLVGDPLQLAVGIAFHPHPRIQRSADLFASARHAFQEASREGGGVVTTS